jgi:hypothetical protein
LKLDQVPAKEVDQRDGMTMVFVDKVLETLNKDILRETMVMGMVMVQ